MDIIEDLGTTIYRGIAMIISSQLQHSNWNSVVFEIVCTTLNYKMDSVAWHVD